MRLVIEYTTGDGCTFAADITVPVEYPSSEAFAADFELACSTARASQRPGYSFLGSTFTFADREWDFNDFFRKGVYLPPEIMNVDEWFAAR